MKADLALLTRSDSGVSSQGFLTFRSSRGLAGPQAAASQTTPATRIVRVEDLRDKSHNIQAHIYASAPSQTRPHLVTTCPLKRAAKCDRDRTPARLSSVKLSPEPMLSWSEALALASLGSARFLENLVTGSSTV